MKGRNPGLATSTFPDRNAIIRLVGGYLGLDVLARVQALGTTTEEVTAEQTVQAIAA
jgi:hypothetical protein